LDIIVEPNIYIKQLPLKGSIRGVRGQIACALATTSAPEQQDAIALLQTDERFKAAKAGLLDDGLIELLYGRLQLTK